MFRELKLIAIFSALVLTANSAMAQGYRDATAKANGNFGSGFSAGSRSVRYMQSRATFPYASQVVQTGVPVLTTPTTPQVAQAGTEVRRFSVEPNQSMPGQTAPVIQERRSFSVEPSAPNYRAPVQHHHSTPTYLLPKTDAHKFGG